MFFTDEDIRSAINEGYADLADSTEFYERYANLTTCDRRLYYNLLEILPDTFLSPRRVYNTTRNAWLVPSSPQELDHSTVRQWELTAGSPERMFLRGNWWIGLWPKAGPGEVMRVYYTAIPPAMEDDADEPEDMPEEYHSALSDFALVELFGPRREVAKVQKAWKAYSERRDSLRAYVNSRTALARSTVL